MSELPQSGESGRRPIGTTAYLLVTFVSLALGLPGLGSTGLVRMEGMVAAIAGEMLASGDFLVPRLYGELYTYKPPLLYWLAAAAFHLTGSTSEWALRLPVVLSSALLSLATVRFVGRIAGRRTGVVAGLASVSGALFVQKSRIAEFDAPLACFVGLAVLAACDALVRTGSSTRHETVSWLLCYLALTAAFLTKGLPALLVFIPGLVLAAVGSGRLRDLTRGPHLCGAALFISLAATYLLSAYATAGPALFAQPLDEARLRGVGWSLEAVSLSLLKPALIWAFFLPWSLPLFWARPKGGSAIDRLLRVAWCFLLAGVVAFMLVPTHEPRYYLPLAAPFAVLGAVGVERMALSTVAARQRLPAGLGFLVGGLTVALALWPEALVTSALGRVVLFAFGAATLGVASRAIARQTGPAHLTAVLLLTALSSWGAETLAFGPRRALARDQRQAALALAPSLAGVDTVWTPGPAGSAGKYSALLHYLDRRVQTFGAGEQPPPGAHCLIRTVDLERLGAARLERLSLIAEATGSRWTYGLYLATSGSAPGGS